MKTLAFDATVDADSNLKIPQELAAQIPAAESVHVIVLVPESQERHDWEQLSAQRFLAGYSEGDSVYDAL